MSATALVFEERQFTLPQLQALSDSLSDSLRDRGVTPGARVALMSSNRPEFVAALYAVWRLGAVAVLISPAWKRHEVDHALSVTQPSHAVGDQPALADLMPMLDLDEPIPAGVSGPGPVPSPQADAVLAFSSGTTGLPKAVRHTHGSLQAAVAQWRDALGLSPRDRIQVATPPSHILGLLNIVTALQTGVWIRLHRRFDVDAMLRSIQDDRITVEMAVAPIALALAAHPDLESFDLSSLRYIMWGATPVNASVAETVTRRSGVRWVPAYGTTELPVIACSPLDGARLDSVGTAVTGVALRVVSPERGDALGPGEVGEIEARSASMMSGYLPSEATRDVLRDGWYRTGDLGCLDARGWLTITDRSKEMVKVRGFQVAPAEVESVLYEHPAVGDCAVFGVPDDADGEKVVAAVVARGVVDEAELADWVAGRLASYKRLGRVVFVSAIPRLPSGKVLRRVLKERYGCTSDC